MSATDATQQIITGVDFMGVPTHDVERACEFYGTTLGLPRSAYVPERGYAEFETGNLTISVYDMTKMGMEHIALRNPIALHVDDIEAARSELQRRGVTFGAPTFDTGVCHMAFFDDPDGNALMLHHRYAPRTAEA